MTYLVEMAGYVLVGLGVLIGGLVWKYKLANYEFHNRSTYGGVCFTSMVGSWLHRCAKLLSWLTLFLGGALAFWGILYFLTNK